MRAGGEVFSLQELLKEHLFRDGKLSESQTRFTVGARAEVGGKWELYSR